MNFANLYLPVSGTFSKASIERIDTPLFPILALREAYNGPQKFREDYILSDGLNFGVHYRFCIALTTKHKI